MRLRAASLTFAAAGGAFLAGAAWVHVFHHLPGGDYWEHAAAVRAWSQALLDPANPQLLTPEASPRYTPLIFPIAAGKALLGWSVDTAMAVMALFNAILLLAGVCAFARTHFRTRWAPAALLAIMLGAWGGDPWVWSGVYAAPSLVYVLPYASTGALGAALLTLAALVRVLRMRAPPIPALAGLALAAAVTISAHLLTGAFLLGAAALFIVFDRRAAPRMKAACAAAAAAGFLLALAWPYYDLLGVIMERRTDSVWFLQPQIRAAPPSASPFYEIEGLFAAAGAAGLGLGSAIWFAVRRRVRLYLAGVVLFSLPYLANLIWMIPLGHRFIVYAVFFMHLALLHHALLLLTHGRRARLRTPAPVKLGAGLGALVLLAAAAAGLGRAADRLPDRPGPPVWSDQSGFETSNVAYMAARLGPDAVVAGEARRTWRLGAHGAAALSLLNPNPLVADLPVRSAANTLLMLPDTDPGLRDAVIARYAVTHVLLHDRFLEPYGDLDAHEAWLGEPLAVRGPLRLYAAPRTGPGAADGQPDEAFERRVRCALVETVRARLQAQGETPRGRGAPEAC